MDPARAADAARLAEDVADQIPDRRPPTDEDKLARAMGRIERGTYTAPPQQPARDAGGRFRQTCGDADDLVTAQSATTRLAARVAGAAATGSATEAEAWAAHSAGLHPPPGVLGYAAELAAPSDPSAALTPGRTCCRPPAGPDPELHERMMAELGEAETPPSPARSRSGRRMRRSPGCAPPSAVEAR